jgi:hypothetical protein
MDVNLSGSETAVIKALGLSGAGVPGTVLMSRLSDFGEAELLDAVQGLVSVGYVVSDRDSLFSKEDLARATLRVNTSYTRDLKDTLQPHKRKNDRPRWRG